MKTIIFDSAFLKSYKKRIRDNKKLRIQYQKRLVLFQKNPSSLLLHNHKLTGELINKYAFSITGDIRVVYYIDKKGTIIFLDIGSHNQVY